ncbi:MAG: FAD:protein FMN transferase [Enterobacteriaceae bacterium]
MLLTRCIQWLTLMGLALILLGCGPEQVSVDGKTMGTYYQVKYLADSKTPGPEQIKQEIDRRLEQLNDQMSTYKPDSELSRFNTSTITGVPFTVSPAVIKVVEEAIRINHLTGGALDVTIGPLVNLWGFGPEKRTDQVPDAVEEAKRRSWVGIEKLQVRNGGLVKTIPELYVDLSSIAKGYGVDMVGDYLNSLHISDYMIDIGGEVLTRGKNGKNQPWRIAIEKPQPGNNEWIQQIIEPGDMAMATSGDYRNFFAVDGKHYSHTLNPVTGKPIENNIVSITVLHPSCMTADGFATGLGVMGVDKALALAEQQKLPVFIVEKSGDSFVERYSSAFKPYLSGGKHS